MNESPEILSKLFRSVKHANNFKNLVGLRFGRLIVESEAGYLIESKTKRRTVWRCKCDCGSRTLVKAAHLQSGKTKSCGCFQDDSRTTHGLNHTPEWDVWSSAKCRCFNPNDCNFKRYGARGITMCNGWRESFEAFITDMGFRQPGTSLDRIDNNGNYSCGKCSHCLEQGWPLNCQWATRAQQINNTRRNRFITFNGKRQTLTQWAREIGVNYNTIAGRLARGMSIESAFAPTTSHEAPVAEPLDLFPLDQPEVGQI